MGCSGSKAGSAAGPKSKKSYDENEILVGAGLEKLSTAQMKAFNAWWDALTKIVFEFKEGMSVSMG